ncbi:MAG: cadmium-translocating P-type ATPase [Ruminococcaceae bacterium]|nr:cadmium-translocating P-type ATPase [Oscillospiraceae bacterium]
MSRKQKKTLRRIIAAAVLFVGAALLPLSGWWRLLVFLLPYAIIGYDVLSKAVRGIVRGQVFDENFLMALATVGALCIGEYAEAVFVMLFYQVGELFQSIAVGKSRRSIAALMDIRPDVAHVERTLDDASIRYDEVDPEEIAIGDTIQVRPGERVPLDGTVIEGESYLDTAALTGEPIARRIGEGDAIISGCINQSGTLRIRVDRAYGDSTVARILALVEDSAARKSKSEAFITRFARLYTPAVVIGAALLALIPSLITGEWLVWIERALTFLVISCPCALVISVPLSFFGGIGGASRQGILFKGANYLEMLADCDTVVLDKTGTLTKGSFEVTSICPTDESTECALIELAALTEQFSSHPIAHSLIRAYGQPPCPDRVDAVEEIAGEGVTAKVDGHAVAVGNLRLMARVGVTVSIPNNEIGGTIVYVAREGTLLGHIVIQDELKSDTKNAIAQLRQAGVKSIVMLTGDHERVAAAVADELALDGYVAECLPGDKVNRLEPLLDRCHARSKRARLAFVGDGINDAPVLTRADVGIAMGALGSDAAIEAADVVLMDDKLSKIATAMRLSHRTGHIVRQNIVFALGVKALVLLLGALGLATLWAAVFADVGVAVIAILNAMRTLK